MNSSLTASEYEDLMLAMREAESQIGLVGPQKRDLVITTLLAAGLIRSDQQLVVGAAIDAIVWAAKNRQDVAHFAKRGFKLCC